MNRFHGGLSGQSWSRVRGWSPQIRRSLLADLKAKLGDQPDEREVTVTVGLLRSLLEAHEALPSEPGAAIRDEVAQVTYNVTVGRAPGKAWLRTVEIVPDSDDPDPRVFRVPVRRLAELAAEVLALEDGEASLIFNVPEVGENAPPPDAEELAALIRERIGRQKIADQYGKSLSRVDEWLRLARRERPDLFPARTRGPRPKTPDAPTIREGDR
jgi:hypothetical protein